MRNLCKVALQPELPRQRYEIDIKRGKLKITREVFALFVYHLFGETESVKKMAGLGLGHVGAQLVETFVNLPRTESHQLRFWEDYRIELGA